MWTVIVEEWMASSPFRPYASLVYLAPAYEREHVKVLLRDRRNAHTTQSPAIPKSFVPAILSLYLACVGLLLFNRSNDRAVQH